MSRDVQRVNMNGSSDPYYRYTMPCMLVKVEGTTKMIKSVLTNVTDVCQAIGRPNDYLVTYLGQELSANSKIEKDTDKAYVTGAMDANQIQQLVFKFINEYVACKNCNNPETSVHIEGSKKNKVLFLTCKGCGQRSDLPPEERFVKYMISHPPTDANFGHAKTAAGAVGAAMAEATALDEKRKKKKEKGIDDGEEGDDGEKKKKKKKKDKEKKDDDESPDGGEEGEDGEKKKKKKKKKEGEDGGDEEDGEKKKKKDKKKKKKEEEENDSWEDDWGEDTSEAAVAARALKMGGGINEEALAAKLESSIAVSGSKDDDDDDDDDAPKGVAAANNEDDEDDVDIDDI